MSITNAFSDVPVASPVMIDGSESMENVSDETENCVQNGPTATDDTRCPYSSGSDDSQVSALTSTKELETSGQKSNYNMHKVIQAEAAAILQLQPQVMEIS